MSLLTNLVSNVPMPNKKEVVVSNTDPPLEGCESAFGNCHQFIAQ